MLNTTLDILYLVLAIGLGMLLVTLSVLVIMLMKTVSNINRITTIAEDSADTINGYIKLPEEMAGHVMKWFKHQDFISELLGRRKKRRDDDED